MVLCQGRDPGLEVLSIHQSGVELSHEMVVGIWIPVKRQESRQMCLNCDLAPSFAPSEAILPPIS